MSGENSNSIIAHHLYVCVCVFVFVCTSVCVHLRARVCVGTLYSLASFTTVRPIDDCHCDKRVVCLKYRHKVVCMSSLKREELPVLVVLRFVTAERCAKSVIASVRIHLCY